MTGGIGVPIIPKKPEPSGRPPEAPWPLEESPEEQLEKAYNRIQGNVADGRWTYEKGQEEMVKVYKAIAGDPAIEALRKRDTSATIAATKARFEDSISDIEAMDIPIANKANLAQELYQNYYRSGWSGYIPSQTELMERLEMGLAPEERAEWARMRGAGIGGGPSASQAVARRTALEQTRAVDLETSFEETRLGLAGTQRYRDWFASRYPSLAKRFQSTLPKETTPEEAEKTWVGWLERQKPKLKEEFYAKPEWERGERPSVFAPRIKTVEF